MRRVLAELAVTAALVVWVSVDTPDMWRLLARACQGTALAVGRVGIYAEDRAAILATEGA
ncbi:hypothetical protein [Streptomyces collinus]|uniref:hypothetical protein n=1 Tax=Streptomyces collinus TaxID=42684 RepID=UPI0011DDC745|nr:hypothetical protein [Streptomyces collinus]